MIVKCTRQVLEKLENNIE